MNMIMGEINTNTSPDMSAFKYPIGAMDVDEVRYETNNVMLSYFDNRQEVVDIWWNAPNPRLDGKTPASMLHADPSLFPNAHNMVFEVARTFSSWKPPRSDEVDAMFTVDAENEAQKPVEQPHGARIIRIAKAIILRSVN